MAPPNSGHRRPRPDTQPEWRERAACRDLPTPGVEGQKERVDQWFSSPELNGRLGPRPLTPGEVEAIRVCNDLCNVRDACLEYAVAAGEQSGIWAGRTPAQLNALRRQRHIKGSRS